MKTQAHTHYLLKLPTELHRKIKSIAGAQGKTIEKTIVEALQTTFKN